MGFFKIKFAQKERQMYLKHTRKYMHICTQEVFSLVAIWGQDSG